MKKQLIFAAALTAALATPLAASATHHANDRTATGRIASIAGSTLILVDGTAVFLSSGT